MQNTFYLASRILSATEKDSQNFFPPLPVSLRDPKAYAAHEAVWLKYFSDTHNSKVIKLAARLFPSTPPATFARWQTIRSNITKKEEESEPVLCGDCERCSLFPLVDEGIWAFRKKLEGLHWTTEDADLSNDAADFRKLGAKDQKLVKFVLAFFGIADELIMDGLEAILHGLIHQKEAVFYLRCQDDQECVHSEAYSLQIQEIIPSDERAELFDAIKTLPIVARIADWVRWWTIGDHPAADVFAAMGQIEGCIFSGQFAVLQHYKERNVLAGLTTLNELICRDENIHSSFWNFLQKHRLHRRANADIVKMIGAECVGLCKDFFNEALPVRVIGLNNELLGQYIEFTCDTIYVQAGYEAVYKVENPLSFMDKLALNEVAKVNFFEHRATQYQGLGTKKALEFSIDESEIEF